MLGAGAALLVAAALAGCAGGASAIDAPAPEAMAVFDEYAAAHGLEIVVSGSVPTAPGQSIAAAPGEVDSLEFGVHCTSPSGEARLVLDLGGTRFETICDGRAQPGFPVVPPAADERFVVEVAESSAADGVLTVVLFAPPQR